MTNTLIIPPRPDLLIETQTLLAQPDPDVRRLTTLIRRDVSLYTVLLATVNSPLFRRSFLIESVEHAVTTLGVDRIANLVRAVALRTSLDSEGRWQRFWEAATEVATICHQLAVPLQVMTLESAYTLGMMHDIGVAVMRNSFNQYDQLCSDIHSYNAAFVRRMERSRFNLDRYQVAGQLAKDWYMSEEVVAGLSLQAHAQAALMGNSSVDDAVLAANCLLILAKISVRSITVIGTLSPGRL